MLPACAETIQREMLNPRPQLSSERVWTVSPR